MFRESHLKLNEQICKRKHVCMHICMHVCMHVCMHTCMYVCVHYVCILCVCVCMMGTYVNIPMHICIAERTCRLHDIRMCGLQLRQL